MNHKRFDESFAQHMAYRNNIIKIRKRKVPVHEGKGGHLPPLSIADGQKTEESDRAQSADGKDNIKVNDNALETEPEKIEPATTKAVKKNTTITREKAKDPANPMKKQMTIQKKEESQEEKNLPESSAEAPKEEEASRAPSATPVEEAEVIAENKSNEEAEEKAEEA